MTEYLRAILTLALVLVSIESNIVIVILIFPRQKIGLCDACRQQAFPAEAFYTAQLVLILAKYFIVLYGFHLHLFNFISLDFLRRPLFVSCLAYLVFSFSIVLSFTPIRRFFCRLLFFVLFLDPSFRQRLPFSVFLQYTITQPAFSHFSCNPFLHYFRFLFSFLSISRFVIMVIFPLALLLLAFSISFLISP